MGELGADTAVRPIGDGRYAANLSQDWEIWGPNGGYVASVLLRAVEAASTRARPVSLACQFLSVAAFDEVQMTTEVVRQTRSADAIRVSMAQGDRRIAEGLAWVADADLPGLDHQSEPAIPAPGPDEITPASERRPEDSPSFAFWENLDQRPMDWVDEWPPPEPLPARCRQWLRFTPDLAEPHNRYLDACRSVIIVDTMGWPAASRRHAEDPPRFIAPSLDLYVAFHQDGIASPWLLSDVTAPVSAGGLIGAQGRVWDDGGRLVSSGQSQLLCRPIPPN
jgi:acyl-CoA thioesterase-2